MKKPKIWNKYIERAGETDLTNVDELISRRFTYLGIDQQTLANIRTAAKFILPLKEEIVNELYNQIISDSDLHQMIQDHSTLDRLKVTMEQYFEQLLEANDLLHHLTKMLQDEINNWIEEEDNASKN